MRYVFLVLLMTASMIGLITWATKPEMLVAQYHQAAAPIENYFAGKRAVAWKAARDQAWQSWRQQMQLPGDCARPSSSLRTLECKNQLQLQESTFENEWARKVTSGWQPEGAN
jgi:hypothetical protein